MAAPSPPRLVAVWWFEAPFSPLAPSFGGHAPVLMLVQLTNMVLAVATTAAPLQPTVLM